MTTKQLFFTVAACLGAAACQPRYNGLEISKRSGYGEFRAGHFEIEEGQALTIEVRPISSNPHEDYERFDLVRLESIDDGILLVAPSAEIDQFVLAGRSVGAAGVRVLINDRQEDVIDADVLVQEVDQ